MSINREKIFNSLADKKILIWGARMTGIGALRKLRKKKIKVINFIKKINYIIRMIPKIFRPLS